MQILGKLHGIVVVSKLIAIPPEDAHTADRYKPSTNELSMYILVRLSFQVFNVNIW